MRVYVDGKLSGPPALAYPERLTAAVNPVLDTRHPYAVQVGALNSGWRSMEGVKCAICGFRGSRALSCRLYAAAEKCSLTGIPRSVLLFDKNLEGKGMATGGVRHTGFRSTDTRKVTCRSMGMGRHGLGYILEGEPLVSHL